MSAKDNHASEAISAFLMRLLKRMDEMDMRIANSQITGRVAEVNGNRVRVVMNDQGANGQPVLSPWVQLQEAAGATGTNMPVKIGDPLRILSINGEIGNSSIAIRDSYADDVQNPARNPEELAITYGGGALRMNKDEILITHGGNSIQMNASGLFLKHGDNTVEITSDLIRALSTTLMHNKKSIGDTHIHFGVKSGGSNTAYPV